MASGRRKQYDKPNFAFVTIEVALYVSDVGRIFTAASELKRSESGKAEYQNSHDTDLDISSFSHIHLNSNPLRSFLAGKQPNRRNNKHNNHPEAA